jgi:hypothetical protein
MLIGSDIVKIVSFMGGARLKRKTERGGTGGLANEKI